MDDVLKKLRERAKRTVLRKIETGEITYSRGRKCFIYQDTEEEYKLQGGDNDESDSDDDEEDDVDSDEDKKKKEAAEAKKKKK